MALLPPSGPKSDFYCAGNSVDFAYFPGSLVPDLGVELIPIRLQRGDPSFGAIHIVKAHGHWLDVHKMDVATMVWTKLRHNGLVYTTEKEGKLKINLALNPKALLVMQLNRPDTTPYFSVTSLYINTTRLDGERIGYYNGGGVINLTPPTFTLPTPPAPPVVTIKKRKTLILP